MKDIKIGYAGMSHLGVNSSIAAAEKVSQVIAFDENKKIINALKIGQTDIDEPYLRSKMITFKDKIHYTSNIDDLRACDIVYISKDVPTNNEGESDLRVINKLIKEVNSLKKIMFIITVNGAAKENRILFLLGPIF